jgi:PAS domain S-box-containing protein
MRRRFCIRRLFTGKRAVSVKRRNVRKIPASASGGSAAWPQRNDAGSRFARAIRARIPWPLKARFRLLVGIWHRTRQLELLNAELERRVSDRTAALEISNARLTQSEQGRTLALEAGDMGSWAYHAGSTCWEWDEGHSNIFGLDHAGRARGWTDVRRFVDAADWAVLTSALERATPANNTFRAEVRIRRPDGQTRICTVAVAATFDRAGRLKRIDGVTVDITGRKEIERVQHLLAREVDHRARNALANVQAIMRLTRADTLQDYSSKVERRVHALAHTHELLSNARWQGADIRDIVRDEMAPFGTCRTSIAGPSVILPPEKAQTIALTLHELATNAAKFGALSSRRGHVGISWTFVCNVLRLDWVEAGGPEVVKPVKTGFGTQIIRASLDRTRADQAAFDWDPRGLRCALVVHCGAPAVEGAVSDRTSPSKQD